MRAPSGSISAPGAAGTAGPATPSSWLLWLALGYTLVPIYGSLIPLDWQDKTLATALEELQVLIRNGLRIDSRADFAANLLLAVPLALLWLATLRARLIRSGQLTSAMMSLVVWLACTTLAAGIEFLQLFTSSRVAALSDVLAQSLGALLGVLAYPFVPATIWQRSNGAQQSLTRLTGLYTVGLLIYAAMPLDLTVSVSDIARKLRENPVRLMPFEGWGSEPVFQLLSFAADVLIWLGLAGLLTMHRRLNRWQIIARVLGLAVLVESLQIFVISRTTDSTDLLAALAGALLGTRLAQPGGLPQPAGRFQAARLAVPGAIAFALCIGMLWPLEFSWERAHLQHSLARWSALPFHSYQANSELYLVTNILRRIAGYGLLASALCWALTPRSQGSKGRRWRSLCCVGLCVALAAVIETFDLLRLDPRGGHADTADLLIAGLSALLVSLIWEHRHDRAAHAVPAHASASSRKRALVATGLLTLFFWLLATATAIPYNLRELLSLKENPFSALALSGVIVIGLLGVLGSSAFGAGTAQATARWRWGALPIAASLMAFLTLIGLPLESIHDVVGSPVLAIPHFLELWGRLLVLQLGLLWALAWGTSINAASSQQPAASLQVFLQGLYIAPIWHGIVVHGAATDNLTELMAGGGSALTSAALLGYAALLGFGAGALLRLRAAPSNWLRVLAVLSISAFGGWQLLGIGLESLLVKYGKAFSGLQFLLSTDRQHYAGPQELLLRFLLAHGLGITLLGLGLRLMSPPTPLRAPQSREVSG